MDCFFAFVLFYFKEASKVPMSTTWVFLGLLGGREIGMSFEKLAGPKRSLCNALKLSIQDLAMGIAGFTVSLGIIAIQKPAIVGL